MEHFTPFSAVGVSALGVAAMLVGTGPFALFDLRAQPNRHGA